MSQVLPLPPHFPPQPDIHTAPQLETVPALGQAITGTFTEGTGLSRPSAQEGQVSCGDGAGGLPGAQQRGGAGSPCPPATWGSSPKLCSLCTWILPGGSRTHTACCCWQPVTEQERLPAWLGLPTP